MKSFTAERAYALTSLMIADKERAKKFMLAGPDKAREQINALGYDYSLDEITEYINALKNVILGRPREDNLDDVTGGVNESSAFADLDLDIDIIKKANWS